MQSLSPWLWLWASLQIGADRRDPFANPLPIQLWQATSQPRPSEHNGRMTKPRFFAWIGMLLLVLGALAMPVAQARKTSSKQLDKMLYEYSSSVRWSEFETAWTYVDPAYRLENPLTDFQVEHYKQFQVSGYDVKNRESVGKAEYRQLVEIRLINRHTLTEKVITERELWRWDPASKRWWLTTGLPKLSAN